MLRNLSAPNNNKLQSKAQLKLIKPYCINRLFVKLILLFILIANSISVRSQSLIGISNTDFDFLNQPSTVNTNLGFTQIDNVQYFGIRF